MRLSETSKFKLFYFIRFFGDAFFYPFMSIYFIQKSMTEDQLGIILAITPIVTILANPMWTYLVKDTKISRIVLIIMTIIEGSLIIGLTQVTTFELVALLIGMIALICSPFVSLQDGFSAVYCNNHQVEYSSLRIYASIAYVIATLIAGYVGFYYGYELLFMMAGIFFIVTSLVAFWIKPIEHSVSTTPKPKRNIKALLKNKNFYKYLIFYTLVVGGVRIGDSFFGVYITNALDMSAIGYGWIYSMFVLVEVVVLRWMIQKGPTFSEKQLIIVATVSFLLRFLVYVLNLPLPLIILFSMLRGVSWGILLYVHIRYVIRIVKVENVTAAIMIITLLFSIFTGIGNAWAGRFITLHGYAYLYGILSVIISLGLVFYLIFPPRINASVEGSYR